MRMKAFLMADMLRPRLDRLQELSKKVNAATDDAGRIVQGVESYLNDILHLGVRASIVIEAFERPEEFYRAEKQLVYGRYGPKFRIFVTHTVENEGSLDVNEETLWANCPRDQKLLAFNYLPALLDELVERLETTLEQVESNSETIQALLPPVKEKGAKP